MRMVLGWILLLTACSQPTTALGDGDVPAATDDAIDVHFGTDTAAPADAAPDVVKDAVTDAIADTKPDAPADVVVDAVADSLADVVDAVADVLADVLPDVAQSDAAPPDVAADVPPDAVAEIADDAATDAAAADVPLPADKAGCADGTREGFGDQQVFPTIAACGGAWDQPGIFNMPAKCSNHAGNDGANAAGTGCTVTDLCAVGWHVCYGKDDVVYRNPNGCAGVMTGATPPVFFTTQMSSTGAFNCASGTTATNDLFGCGNLGCGDWCNHLGKYPGAPNSWDCGTDGDKEALNVVKSHPEQQGGVLCCLD